MLANWQELTLYVQSYFITLNNYYETCYVKSNDTKLGLRDSSKQLEHRVQPLWFSSGLSVDTAVFGVCDADVSLGPVMGSVP